MQPAPHRTIIVHTRLKCPGENMLEPKQSVHLRDVAIMAFWDVFPRDGSRGGRISHVLEKAGASDPAFYKEDQSKEDIVSVFLNDRHVAWMRWFEKKLETKYTDTGGGLEIIADVLEEGFEDPKSFALAFIDVVTRTSDSDKEPLAIAGDQKEHLRRLIEQLAVRMDLGHPDMVAATAVVIIEQTILRTLMTGSPTEAHTARLRFQCLQHG
jgi:AcrR family transcriptional regulator